jgi:hypothetical protein
VHPDLLTDRHPAAIINAGELGMGGTRDPTAVIINAGGLSRHRTPDKQP